MKMDRSFFHPIAPKGTVPFGSFSVISIAPLGTVPFGSFVKIAPKGTVLFGPFVKNEPNRTVPFGSEFIIGEPAVE